MTSPEEERTNGQVPRGVSTKVKSPVEERVKEEAPVDVQVVKPRALLLTLIGISIPLALILGSYLGIPQRITIPYAVLATLVASSISLWTYANKDAEGDEWWQDDDASGWRGY